MLTSVDDVQKALKDHQYLISKSAATAVFLAHKLNKPLLVEGPAGVGKTELGKVIAKAMAAELIRLQCYEGLDEAKTLFEWNYQKQLLYIQSFYASDNKAWQDIKKNIYSQEFILERPILRAFTRIEPTVLLIDELDKSDDEFESFLLEALSEFQVSIPEYGVIKAVHPPFIILTSNNQRQLSDALKRRCVYLYMDFPDFEQEMEIVRLKIPEIHALLAEKVVLFVQSVRKLNLRKLPSVAETLDWAAALMLLGKSDLDHDTIKETLSMLLKYKQDYQIVEKKFLHS